MRAPSHWDVAETFLESGDLLLGYYDAVHAQSLTFLRGLTAGDFERIVDERWDPPVTLGGHEYGACL